MSGKPSKLKFKGAKRKQKDHSDSVTKKNKPAEDGQALISRPPILQRDDWMTTPGGLQSTDTKEDAKKEKFVKEQVLSDVKEPKEPLSEPEQAESRAPVKPQLRQVYEVPYEFGDLGSNWRMMKLKKLLDAAEEANKTPEILALQRYGNLLNFDIAREELKELEDRKSGSHVFKYKPTGYFYHQRQFADDDDVEELVKTDVVVDEKDLNELKAKMLRAKLRKLPEYDQLKKEYEEMERKSKSKPELKVSEGNKFQEMAKEQALSDDYRDLVRESVKSILKDKKYSTDLDEQDEKLSSLAKNIRDGKLQITGDVQNLQKLNKALERCNLCLDNNRPLPILHQTEHLVVALLPHPAITEQSLMVFPKQHRSNSLKFSREETNDLKRLMVVLSKHYSDKLRKKVIFHETSNRHHLHCSIEMVLLPRQLDDHTIYDHFKNGLLEQSNDLDQQHKIIIDTREKSYDNYIPSEAPFFHLWITLQGGIGHIIESETWPAGGLFARQVVGGLLRLDKFDVEARTRLYVGNGITDGVLKSVRRDLEGIEW